MFPIETCWHEIGSHFKMKTWNNFYNILWTLFILDFRCSLAVFANYCLRKHLHLLCEQNIVHGDIKPDNLLVTAAGTVKIGDFSVSQLFEVLIYFSYYSIRTITCTYVLLGDDTGNTWNETVVFCATYIAPSLAHILLYSVLFSFLERRE